MSNFVDKISITVHSGAGGNGCVAFRREKYVAAGGPDGGDGGRGGDVIVAVDDHLSTLLDFRYKRKYKAGNGEDGRGKRCSGKDGQSIVLKVPRGTIIRDEESQQIIADMSGDEPFILCRGGNGGWGNHHFATPTRQTPQFAKAGLPGRSRSVILELKLLADVGLLGFPNVGKSSLLAVATKARPNIANYHFTTLFPNLGVVYVTEGVSFVMADIPGIIEGAHEGTGLGYDFLRHIDRCRLLIHMVDISGSEGRDPIEDFEIINAELQKYSPELAERKMLIAANKMDILENPEQLARFRAHVEAKGYALFELSTATTLGVSALMAEAAAQLAKLPPVIRYEADFVEPLPQVDSSAPLEIQQEGDVWIVDGPWLQRLIANVNFGNYESRNWFDRQLREAGLFERLEELGIQDGDLVSMYHLEFEYRR